MGFWLEKDLREAYEAYRPGFTAGDSSDWRAADAVLYQVYGRAPTELELTAGVSGPVSLTIESAFTLDEPGTELGGTEQQLLPPGQANGPDEAA
jgi:hypothetical protein